jgi:DNA-binding MarR family transcriptional regulator
MNEAADGRRPTLSEVQRVAEFRMAMRRFVRRSDEIAQSAGLTPQRYSLLMMIKASKRGDEQASVGELARSLQLAQNTVTELVNRAVAEGLVTRTPSSEDGRVAYVRLTDEGERRFGKAFQGLAEERAALRAAVAQL